MPPDAGTFDLSAAGRSTELGYGTPSAIRPSVSAFPPIGRLGLSSRHATCSRFQMWVMNSLASIIVLRVRAAARCCIVLRRCHFGVGRTKRERTIERASEREAVKVAGRSWLAGCEVRVRRNYERKGRVGWTSVWQFNRNGGDDKAGDRAREGCTVQEGRISLGRKKRSTTS